ncbi:MAG: hypothetical protein ABFR89_05720 [Actinomycetota bacterium]
MTEKKSWMDKLSETVDKATKAAGEAWDGTADVRKEAWEKTKAAGTSASAAIEEGVEKAKSAYQGGEAEPAEVEAVEEEPQDPVDAPESDDPETPEE